MRLAEIAAREDLLGVLQETLQAGWSEWRGTPIQLSLAPQTASQAWRVQPLLSCVIALPTSARARRFLADSFRYTPSAPRAVGQWLLGTFLASRMGLRLTARPRLWVTPPLAGADDLVVLPGNRRIRIFDLRTGRCRVLLKAGYAVDPMRTEILVRGAPRRGPFASITAWDPGWRWFDEEVVDGHSLPRCPPWWPRARLERESLELMDTWLAESASPASAQTWAGSLHGRIIAAGHSLEGRLTKMVQSRFLSACERLVARAGFLGKIEVACSHGDFQPGNVLVEARSRRVLLTDWEYSAQRFRWYDQLVWGLRSRSWPGLEKRLERFVASGALQGAAGRSLPSEAADRGWREAALALFLLEELAWSLEDAMTGPRADLPQATGPLLGFAERGWERCK